MRSQLVRSWVGWFGGAGLLLLATVSVVSAQTGTVTGRVVDQRSLDPIAGAQVHIPSSNIGALSNADGRYLILNVPVGEQTVRVQIIGYAPVEQTVTVTSGQAVALDFQIAENAIPIDEIVVTAMGIEVEEKSLGYAVQTVNTERLQRTPEVNLVQALQGQTAGVQVVQSSGRPGASSRINIRGQSTFTGSGQPLFIIDGMPVSVDLDSNQGRSALGYGEAGNRAMDLDMSNVQEISVLRGAAATALYGSRAAAGAVVIKTKTGQPGAPLRFEIASSYRRDTPIVEGYITDWAAGRDGYLCDGLPESEGGYCEPGYPGGFESVGLGSSSYPNWGPHKDSLSAQVINDLGTVRFVDARDDYYQTAQTWENSLRASGSMSDRGTYTFGISYLDQGDITTTGKLERLNLSGNVNLTLSNWLNSRTSVQRINTVNPWPNDSWNSVHHNILHIPPNVDTREAWHEDGTPILWGPNTPHYAWVEENEYEETDVDRWIVSQQFYLNLFPGVTLSNRSGLDTYVDQRRRYQNERPWRTAEGLPSGSTQQEKIQRTQFNNDFVLTLDGRQLSQDLTLSGLIGNNVLMQDVSRIIGRGTDIVIPDYYNVENFVDQRVFSDLPEKRRLVGLYGQATLDYRGWAYLTLTGRNDWSSTLPKNANSFFYPSASLGFIFTDALGWQTNWLQYGKIRLSYAKVGIDAPPYSLSSVYNAATAPGAHNGHYQFDPTTVQFPFNTQVGFLQGTQLGNPTIKPEATTEFEIGTELRLFQNRARLDVSYYDKKSYDQIFTVPSSSASGYTSIVRNAGDLRNQGWEVSVQGRPIQTRDFSWDLRANWTRNRNKVIELAPGVDNLILAGYSWPSIRILEGYGYGVIWGYGFQRNCVENTSDVCFSNQPAGTLLIGDEDCISDRGGSCYGLPIRTQQQIPLGEALPDWLANISTQFRWRGVGLSALFDIRKGSRILNFEIQYTTGRNGRHILTEERGTTTVVEGINVNTGQPNTHELVKDQFYYERMYGYDRHENQIEPGHFVKLREVTLSYDLPREWIGNIGVDAATLYVTGRNLKIWSDFSMGDPEADIYGGSSAAGQFFRQFPAPQTQGLTMGVRAAF